MLLAVGAATAPPPPPAQATQPPATTTTVCPTDAPGCDFTSIQAAIDASSPRNVIAVRPGIYQERVRVDVADLTICSTDGPLDVCSTHVGRATLDGHGASEPTVRVLAAGVTFTGFVVRNSGATTMVEVAANGARLRHNRIGGRLSVAQGAGGIAVDARLNDWETDSWSEVGERIRERDGTVLALPIRLEDGSQAPPPPTADDAAHCAGFGFEPRFIEEAFWCAHAGDTILLHPADPVSMAAYVPTPDGFFGNPAGNLVWKNRALLGVDSIGEPIWGSGFDGGELLAGLTICSGGPKDSGQNPPEPTPGGTCEFDPTGVIVDPEGGTDSALDVRAPDVTVAGLTLRNTSEDAGRHGIFVRADGVEVNRNSIVGNFLPSEHTGGPTVNQIGVFVTGSLPSGFTIEDNTVRNWKNVGIYLSASTGDDGALLDNAIRQNRWHGLLLEGPAGAATDRSLEVRRNTIAENGFSGIRFGVSDTSNFEIRRNRLGVTNQFSVTVQSVVDNARIDVRGNDWGIYDWRLLPTRVDDAGADNRVLQVPFVDADGAFEPPLVRRFATPGQVPPDRFFGIQDAIDDPTTAADSKVNVPKGRTTPWLEAVVVDKDGVHLCGQRSDINPCLIGDTAADKPTIDAIALGAPAVTVAATDVIVEGFLLKAAGTGLLVGGDDATLNRLDVRVDGPVPFFGIDVALAFPPVSGLTVRDSVIRPLESGSTIVGEDGIRGRLEGADLRGNDIRRFASGVRLRPFGRDNVVRDSTFSVLNTGVVTWSPGTLVQENSFSEVNMGVDIAAVDDPSASADGNVLRRNTFIGTVTALRVRGSGDGVVTDTHVDARRNAWGSTTRSGVAGRINLGGTGNTVDISCFLDHDQTGEFCPPTPLVLQPSREGAQNTTSVTVSGRRAEPGAIVTIRDAATSDVRGEAAADGIGTWEEEAVSFVEGDHEITVQGTLITGNGIMTRSEVSDPPHPFTVDLTPPILTLDTPADGTVTNIIRPEVSGTAGTEDGDLEDVTVRVHLGDDTSGATVATLTTTRDPDTGEWTVTLTEDLADGTYTAQAEQSDEAGNTGVSSASTFIIHTVAPLVVLATPSEGTATNDTTPGFSGTAGTDPGDAATVTVKVHEGSDTNDPPARTITTTRDETTGEWSVTLPLPPLAEGAYAAQAEQSDAAGNTGFSGANTFLIDTTPPASAITFPEQGARYGSQAWAAGCGAPDDDVCGTADDPQNGGVASGVSKVEFSLERESTGAFWGGTAFDAASEVFHEADGAVSWTASFPFGNFPADDAYTVRSRAHDEAGNVESTASVSFTVDSVPPVVTLDTPGDGTVTNDPRPAFSGTAGTATGDLSTVSVTLHEGDDTAGPAVLTLTADGSTGTWSVTPDPGVELADGTYTAQAEQSDDAGNIGTSGAHTFILDTEGPISTIGFPQDGAVYDQLTWPDGCTPEGVCGTAADASTGVDTVEFSIQRAGDGTYWDGTAFAAPSEVFHEAGGTAEWSAPFPFSNFSTGDDFTLVVRAIDTAGNVETTAATFGITVAAPEVTLETPVHLSFTKDTRPVFSGTTSTALGDPEVAVHIHAGTDVSGPLVLTLLTTRDAGTGAWSVRPDTAGALAEGRYIARAEQFDSATGALGRSAANRFTVDTTPPLITLDPVDSPTGNPRPDLTGTAGADAGDLDPVLVRIHSGPDTTGPVVQTLVTTRDPDTGTYGVTPAEGLAGGTYTAQARQADAAGNIGVSAERTFTVTVDCDVTVDSGESIQDTIAVAAPGDRVCVAAGTYAEDVLIETPAHDGLTVAGANAGVPAGVTPGARTAESVIEGTITLNDVTGVTIDGLTVISDGAESSIRVRSAVDDLTVTNTILDGRGTTDDGILSDASAPSRYTFTNNTIRDYLVHGIGLDANAGSVLDGNAISQVRDGVALLAGANDHIVTGNSIADSRGGVAGRGISIGSSGNLIEGNTIETMRSNPGAGRGVFLSAGGDNRVTGNSIRDNDTGIVVGPAAGTGNVVADNELSGNTVQAADESGTVDVEALWVANDFDRGVVVRDAPDGVITVPAIFSSIQDGLAAADSGDTVAASAGTYTLPGTVSLTAAVTLVGPNHLSDPTQGGDREDEAVITSADPGDPVRRALRIRTDDPGVTIAGFTFANVGTAIWVNGEDHVKDLTITNNIFTGNDEAFGTSQAGPGQPNMLDGLRFEGNLVDGNAARAFSHYTGIMGTDFVIDGNEIRDSLAGIHLGFVDGVQVSNNSITINAGFWHILLAGEPARNIDIHGNSFNGDEVAAGGIVVWGDRVDIGRVSVADNAFTGFLHAAIDVRQEPGQVTDVSNWTLRWNRFEGNANAIVNGGTGVIDARFNWWGDPSGPLAGGDAAGPPGSVTVVPWCLEESCTLERALGGVLDLSASQPLAGPFPGTGV